MILRGGEEIRGRIFDFAVRSVKLADFLARKRGAARILASQFLRAATSAGANFEEAQAAESRSDFLHKLSIALKEARECHWWLRVLAESAAVDKRRIQPITREADGIVRTLGAIIATTKGKRRKSQPVHLES